MATLYGITIDQHLPSLHLVRNAFWYNQYGIKIGTGDLVFANLETVAKNIFARNLFIVLSERAGCASRFGQCDAIDGDEFQYTQSYIAKHCLYIVQQGSILKVMDEMPTDYEVVDGKHYVQIDEGAFEVLLRSDVENLMRQVSGQEA